jgi:hypothetical protein
MSLPKESLSIERIYSGSLTIETARSLQMAAFAGVNGQKGIRFVLREVTEMHAAFVQAVMSTARTCQARKLPFELSVECPNARSLFEAIGLDINRMNQEGSL